MRPSVFDVVAAIMSTLTRALVLLLVASALVWTATPANAIDLPPGAIAVPSTGTFLYVHGEPGDSVGMGQELLFTTAGGAIGGWLTAGPGPYGFFGRVDAPQTWFVDLRPAAGDVLAIGSYTDADRALIQRPGHPGLSVQGEGRGCNESTGRFEISELSFWHTGELRLIDATFEFHCEREQPALYGRMRVETPQPLPLLDLHVTIDDKAVADPQTGFGTISGTVKCSRPTTVTISGGVNQSLGSNFAGGAYEFQMQCQAPSTAWSATMPPIIGSFKGGPSDYSHVSAYSCDIYFSVYTYCYVGFYWTEFNSRVYFNSGH